MANPTLITAGFQKHVSAQSAYRANTFLEQTERIIGASYRLRGLEFVSENPGADVTLSPGDFISAGHILDASKPTRTSGIIIRLESPVIIDISGFTDTIIYGFVDDAIESSSNPIKFYVTESLPPPDIRYAPIIYKTSGLWYNYNGIGNDELAKNIILATGAGTIPAGLNNPITITHNLNLAAYKVILQTINLTVPAYDLNGLVAPVEAGEIWTENQLVNSFDVNSDSNPSVSFNWMVIR
jgi:hypothetical protein